jgi:two-component system response regulator
MDGIENGQSGSSTRQVEVLVIEDDDLDRFWLQHTVQMCGRNCAFSTVADGEQAVDFLLKRGEYDQAPTPDLIFLDVHLPIFDGIEILRQLPNARKLPICVLTTSVSERARFRAEFGIQDSDYILKPVSREKLQASPRCHDQLGL